MATLIERKDEKKMSKLELGKKLEAMRERDNELVTGVFRYLEHRGGTLRFRFKKYAKDEYKAYELIDGERYKLPRMVARHLNQEVNYRNYKHLANEMGVHAAMNSGASRFAADGGMRNIDNMHVVSKVARCEFISLEFMDEDLSLMPSNISEARVSA